MAAVQAEAALLQFSGERLKRSHSKKLRESMHCGLYKLLRHQCLLLVVDQTVIMGGYNIDADSTECPTRHNKLSLSAVRVLHSNAFSSLQHAIIATLIGSQHSAPSFLRHVLIAVCESKGATCGMEAWVEKIPVVSHLAHITARAEKPFPHHLLWR